jgi:hypothetical protein
LEVGEDFFRGWRGRPEGFLVQKACSADLPS